MELYYDISYNECVDIEKKNMNLAIKNIKKNYFKNNKNSIINKSKIIKRTDNDKKNKNKVNKNPLKISYYNNDNDNDNNNNINDNKLIIEAGVDEAGRGPMFGRVYTACVVLPTKKENPDFNFSLLKDSKRFTSKKKLEEAYNYIIDNSKDYNIQFLDAEDIDIINIRNATLQCMIQSILNLKKYKPNVVLIDGCDFPRNYYNYNKKTKVFEKCESKLDFESICIEGGDNQYCSIAAASILAKFSRDKWIEEMCILHPYLDTVFYMNSHKGYGTKKHIDAIKQYGITKWHRKSFGICKTSKEFNNEIDNEIDNDNDNI